MRQVLEDEYASVEIGRVVYLMVGRRRVVATRIEPDLWEVTTGGADFGKTMKKTVGAASGRAAIWLAVASWRQEGVPLDGLAAHLCGLYARRGLGAFMDKGDGRRTGRTTYRQIAIYRFAAFKWEQPDLWHVEFCLPNEIRRETWGNQREMKVRAKSGWDAISRAYALWKARGTIIDTPPPRPRRRRR